MGKTRVALCLAPTRLEINGKPDRLDGGKSLLLPGRVRISRIGNVYDIRRRGGDVVHAVVNDGWIDVSVGLGQISRAAGRDRGSCLHAFALPAPWCRGCLAWIIHPGS
jgi:hypothetical protein